MALFMFNKYIREVAKETTDFSSIVPVTDSSKLGIALISSSASSTIDANTDMATIAANVAQDVGETSTPCVSRFGSELHGGSVSISYVNGEVLVQSSSISFGSVPATTTISAIGAVVFVSTNAVVEDSTNSLSDVSSVPVCYMDFGGSAIESSSGPFKVIFSGGDTTTEPETVGTIFKYKQG